MTSQESTLTQLATVSFDFLGIGLLYRIVNGLTVLIHSVTAFDLIKYYCPIIFVTFYD